MATTFPRYVSRMPRVVSLKETDWKYRGEGNKSLVLALPNEQVLRMLKENCSVDLQTKEDNSLEELSLQAEYYSTVVMPLIGRDFAPQVELIVVPDEEAKELSRLVESYRPEYRKTKRLKLRNCYGFCLPDCTFLPKHYLQYKTSGSLITVEVKPKMGFLPTSPFIPQDQLTKLQVCKFQLLQRKKKRDGRISSISDYCPLDLFSGCRVRMKRALEALLQNPQNNLAIFQDGRLVFGDRSETSASEVLDNVFNSESGDSLKVGSSETFCHLLCEALLKAKDSNDDCGSFTPGVCQCKDRSCSGSESCQCKDCRLPKTCILGRILQMQKRDDLDVEGVCSHFNEIMKQHFSKERLQRWLYGSWESGDTAFNGLYPKLQNSILKVRDFLISATAKDCSVMICMQELLDSQHTTDVTFVVTDMHMKKYLVSAKVVDLDMKPMNRIPKYLEEERGLVQDWT